MRKIVVYQVGLQFFLPVANGVVPVSSAVMNQWRETGTEIDVIEEEQYA